MSEVIDDKVVRLRFDGDKFEKDCERATSAIDKLRESLYPQKQNNTMEADIKADTKASKKLAKQLKKTNFDKAEQAFDALASKIQISTIAVGTAIGNVASKVTTSLVAMANEATRSFSNVAAIKSGYSAYETFIDSQAMAVNAVRKIGETEEEAAERVNEVLEVTSWYSDETSHSFLTLQRSIGSMLSYNVMPLEEMNQVIMGIGNACSFAAQNAASAQETFTTWMRVLGSGGLTNKNTFFSLVNQGHMTAEMRQGLIDAAAEIGTIELKGGKYKVKKQAKDAKYQTNKTNWSSFKKLHPEGITADNIQDALSFGIITPDVIAEYFSKMGSFSALVKDIQDLYDIDSVDAAVEKIEELGIEYDETSRKAFEAAQKTKTLSEAVGYVSTALTGSWRQSWSIIVGGFTEARDTFSKLSEDFYELFVESAGARNDALEEWKDLGGRNYIVDAFADIMDAVKMLVSAWKEVSGEVFPALSGAVLFLKSLKIKKNTEKIVRTISNNLEKIKNIFRGIVAVADIFITVIKSAWRFITKIVGLFSKKFGGSIIDTLSDLGVGLSKLAANLKKAKALDALFDSVYNFIESVLNIIESTGVGKAFKKAVKYISDGLSELFSLNPANANKTEKETSLFLKIWEKIAIMFNKIKARLIEFWDFIKPYLNKMWTLLKEKFGETLDWLYKKYQELKSMRLDELLDTFGRLLLTFGSLKLGVSTFQALRRIGWFSETLEEVGYSFQRLLNTFKDKIALGMVTALVSTISSAILKVAIAMLIMSALNPNEINQGLIVIATVFTGITGMISMASKLLTGSDPKILVAASRIITRVGLSTLLISHSLAVIWKTVSQFKSGWDFIKVFSAFITIVVGVVWLISVLGEASKKLLNVDYRAINQMSKSFTRIGVSMLLMASSLSLITLLVSKYGWAVAGAFAAMSAYLGIVTFFVKIVGKITADSEAIKQATKGIVRITRSIMTLLLSVGMLGFMIAYFDSRGQLKYLVQAGAIVANIIAVFVGIATVLGHMNLKADVLHRAGGFFVSLSAAMLIIVGSIVAFAIAAKHLKYWMIAGIGIFTVVAGALAAIAAMASRLGSAKKGLYRLGVLMTLISVDFLIISGAIIALALTSKIVGRDMTTAVSALALISLVMVLLIHTVASVTKKGSGFNSKAVTKLGLNLMLFTGVVAILSGLIIALSFISMNKLVTAGIIVGGIMTLLLGVAYLLNRLTKTKSGFKASQLNKLILSLLLFSGVVAVISGIVYALSTVASPKALITSAIIVGGIMALLTAVVSVLALVSKSKGIKIGKLLGFVAAILLLTVAVIGVSYALKILAESLLILTAADPAVLASTVDSFAKAVWNVAGAIALVLVVFGLFIVALSLIPGAKVTLAIFAGVMLSIAASFLAVGVAIDSVCKLIDVISEKGEAFAEKFPIFMKGVAEGLGEFFVEFFKQVQRVVPEMASALVSVITEIANSTPQIIDGMFAIGEGILNGLIEHIPKIIEQVATLLEKVLTTIGENSGKVIGAAIDMLLGIIKGFGEALTTRADEIKESLKTFFEGLGNAAAAVIESGVAAIVEIPAKIISAIINGLVIGSAAMEILGEKVKSIKDAIKEKFKAIFGKKEETDEAIALGNAYTDALSASIKELKDDISEVKGLIKDNISKPLASIANGGDNKVILKGEVSTTASVRPVIDLDELAKDIRNTVTKINADLVLNTQAVYNTKSTLVTEITTISNNNTNRIIAAIDSKELRSGDVTVNVDADADGLFNTMVTKNDRYRLETGRSAFN